MTAARFGVQRSDCCPRVTSTSGPRWIGSSADRSDGTIVRAPGASWRNPAAGSAASSRPLPRQTPRQVANRGKSQEIAPDRPPTGRRWWDVAPQVFRSQRRVLSLAHVPRIVPFQRPEGAGQDQPCRPRICRRLPKTLDCHFPRRQTRRKSRPSFPRKARTCRITGQIPGKLGFALPPSDYRLRKP